MMEAIRAGASVDFVQLWMTRGQVARGWLQEKRDADAARGIEGEACERIQRFWRGERIRKRMATALSASIKIQGVHRGHLSRQDILSIRNEFETYQATVFLHVDAVEIQRIFRAYYSRQYYHNFAARKAYIAQVADTGQKLRDTMDAFHAEQAAELDRQDKIKGKIELQQVTENLHHLVSTKSIPGIYNSPYQQQPHTIHGIPLEIHLSNGIKALLQLRAQNNATKRSITTKARSRKKDTTAKATTLPPPPLQIDIKKEEEEEENLLITPSNSLILHPETSPLLLRATTPCANKSHGRRQ